MSNFGLHIIENPNGSFSFVGSVPFNLGYVTKAGNKVSAEEVDSQLRLPSSYRTIKTRSFATKDEACREAASLGYFEVSGI